MSFIVSFAAMDLSCYFLKFDHTVIPLGKNKSQAGPSLAARQLPPQHVRCCYPRVSPRPGSREPWSPTHPLQSKQWPVLPGQEVSHLREVSLETYGPWWDRAQTNPFTACFLLHVQMAIKKLMCTGSGRRGSGFHYLDIQNCLGDTETDKTG